MKSNLIAFFEILSDIILHIDLIFTLLFHLYLLLKLSILFYLLNNLCDYKPNQKLLRLTVEHSLISNGFDVNEYKHYLHLFSLEVRQNFFVRIFFLKVILLIHVLSFHMHLEFYLRHLLFYKV